MKLSEYMPEMPGMAKQIQDLNQGLNFVQLMKQQGDTSTAPSIGLDHIVNTWVRHQMALGSNLSKTCRLFPTQWLKLEQR